MLTMKNILDWHENKQRKVLAAKVDENGKEERKPWEQEIHRRGVAALAAVQWWEPIPASGPRAKPARSIV